MRFASGEFYCRPACLPSQKSANAISAGLVVADDFRQWHKGKGRPATHPTRNYARKGSKTQWQLWERNSDEPNGKHIFSLER